MPSPGPSRLFIVGAALAGLLFAFSLSACDEDEGPGTTVDIGVDMETVDQKVTPPVDLGPDTNSQWPDGPVPDQKVDTGYKPSPFGCTSDKDCFGQRCCPTPWGVKLCTPSCDLKP